MPGRDPVAVLSYDFWRTRFAEDPRVVGTTVRINGTAFTVIGIAPEDSTASLPAWSRTPSGSRRRCSASAIATATALSRACAWVGVIGRLAGDTSIDQAHAEVAGLMRQLKPCTPRTSGDAAPWFARFAASGFKSRRRTLRLFGCSPCAAGLVLLVASANVAGLLLARGLRRRKEIAVRLAIGASRGRLIRLLLVESVLLAAAGGVAGLQVAVWATDVLRALLPQPRPVAGSAGRADRLRRRPVDRRGDRHRAGTSVHAARHGPCHERGIVRRRPAALDRARRVDCRAGRIVGAEQYATETSSVLLASACCRPTSRTIR